MEALPLMVVPSGEDGLVTSLHDKGAPHCLSLEMTYFTSHISVARTDRSCFVKSASFSMSCSMVRRPAEGLQGPSHAYSGAYLCLSACQPPTPGPCGDPCSADWESLLPSAFLPHLMLLDPWILQVCRPLEYCQVYGWVLPGVWPGGQRRKAFLVPSVLL